MCESCGLGRFPRRDVLQMASLAGVSTMVNAVVAHASQDASSVSQEVVLPPIEKKPPRIWAVFLYPPADVVLAGKMEDSWARHQWFTWPGNQFEPDAQQAKFTAVLQKMAGDLGIDLVFHPEALYQKAKIEEFIAQARAAGLDAVLVVNFWNTLSGAAAQIATEAAPTAIVYHSLGSNHQLPPEALRNAEGIYYIHSIENFAEIERALRAVRARKMMAQSRVLRIAGAVKELTETQEPKMGTAIVAIPAGEFNDLFDSIASSPQLQEEAAAFRKMASKVVDVSEEAIVDAIRAHHAVQLIMRRYGADAITIECLMLKHRKPCYSFAWHNGQLIPCGCENDINATLTLMLGRWLLDRGGFQHNPEFDTTENLYFGAHCTCPWKLHGPTGPSQDFFIRPFFHQLPKTPALDVQWTPDEPVLLTKYLTGKDTLMCWKGRVLYSPTCPPTGGCATRVLIELEGLADVCAAYAGPHPVLFCGDRGDARCFKAFAKMYRLAFMGNV